MTVVIHRVVSGSAFGIYAMGDEQRCPLLEFLVQLEQDDQANFKQIRARLDHTAQHGPPRNLEQSRALPDIDCFELKTRKGVRVICFYDKGRIIVCTHGFLKKSQKTPRPELDRARKARDAYFAAKSARTLKRTEDT